jgi:H+/Cl- antiporter ClcA
MPFGAKLDTYKHGFRERLGAADALPQLALLGFFVGIITTLVIILFRWSIESALSLYLPEGDPENFEGLSELLRITLPLGGAILIGAIWFKIGVLYRKTGVTYVMERLAYHQGYMSVKSLFVQFLAGFLTIASGQSSGREGPAVHLGSAAASIMGQYFKLPNNSIRILIACGCAAAISASFNTPIAGVIFAMEVVLMEYSLIGFTPIIIASVTAAFASQIIYGPEPAFFVPQLYLSSPFEIPYIILCGLIIGCISAIFVRLLLTSMKALKANIFFRITLAGMITASGAYLFPEIMGIGYDTVNHTFTGQIALGLLCGIALTKLLVTATTLGLGMPSGMIGPTLFIGATTGGALGIIAQWLMPDIASSTGFYAMLGMGAMMGSVLQAPLAALMAILELTQNPNIILPGMLVIVVSSMFASTVFKQKSVFITMLEAQGLNYNSSPTVQALRSVSVLAIMDRKFARAQKHVEWQEAEEILRQGPHWVIIHNDKNIPVSLLPAVDLVRYMEQNKPQDEKDAKHEAENEKHASIALLEIPAHRQDFAHIYYQATLEEALKTLNKEAKGALIVERDSGGLKRTLGVLTQNDINRYYQYTGN